MGPDRKKAQKNQTLKILKKADKRFKHQPNGFIELFKIEFLKLQLEDGFQDEVQLALKRSFNISKEVYNIINIKI